jgi:hypothetical protein
MAQEILPQYVDRGKDCKNCDTHTHSLETFSGHLMSTTPSQHRQGHTHKLETFSGHLISTAPPQHRQQHTHILEIVLDIFSVSISRSNMSHLLLVISIILSLTKSQLTVLP